MKTYWVLGCIIIGLTQGDNIIKCPLDNHPIKIEDAVSVAIWPAFLAGAIYLKINNFKGKQPTCKGEN